MTQDKLFFKAGKSPLGIKILRNLYLIGENQKWLAKEVGITPAHVSYIISGRTTPSQPVLKRISKALNVDVEELL